MTREHTEGPWLLGSKHYGRIPVHCGGPIVAQVVRAGGVIGERERLGNARLISAAPDMLAALEALIERARQWPETFAAEVERAEKAVRKARGGE